MYLIQPRYEGLMKEWSVGYFAPNSDWIEVTPTHTYYEALNEASELNQTLVSFLKVT
jgi:hypothetical protein